MRAAFYSRPGPAAEVIQVGEQPTPAPGRGEVLVRVHTSGVNPSDWKNRRRPLVAPLIIPHSDGAGVIVMVGEGVAPRRIGERVWIWNAQWKRAFGTAAEYVGLPSAQAVHLPDHVSFEQGACLGIPLFTALQAVRLAQLEPGMRVLVAGGAGAVGHYAIQLAKRRGAEVITTVSSAAKEAHAKAAGADHAIRYRDEDLATRVQEIVHGGVDRVLEVDLSNNARTYGQVLRPGARVVAYGTSAPEAVVPSVPLMQKSASLQLFMVYELPAKDRMECLREIGQLLEERALLHTVALTLPLGEIARAHEMLEGGEVLGNLILSVAASERRHDR
jgi:NADPH2:quinone reductase